MRERCAVCLRHPTTNLRNHQASDHVGKQSGAKLKLAVQSVCLTSSVEQILRGLNSIAGALLGKGLAEYLFPDRM